jgi:hypothetical protein
VGSRKYIQQSSVRPKGSCRDAAHPWLHVCLCSAFWRPDARGDKEQPKGRPMALGRGEPWHCDTDEHDCRKWPEGPELRRRFYEDGGHNLIADTTCFSNRDDLPNTNPRLAPLANYGG